MLSGPQGSWILPPRASFRLTRCKQQNGPGHLSSHVRLGKRAEATGIWGSLPARDHSGERRSECWFILWQEVAHTLGHQERLSCPHPFPKHTDNHPTSALQPHWLQFCSLQGENVCLLSPFNPKNLGSVVGLRGKLLPKIHQHKAKPNDLVASRDQDST